MQSYILVHVQTVVRKERGIDSSVWLNLVQVLMSYCVLEI